MVSILPNSQLYNLTYKFNKSLCDTSTPRSPDNGTVYDVLKSDPKFSKTVELINRSGLRHNYDKIMNTYGTEAGGLTLFVTDDSNIPDLFINTADRFRSEVFLRSYTLNGIADIKYIINNGTTVYKTRDGGNPILCTVKGCKKCDDSDTQVEISINRVGRIVKEVRTTNGLIIMMDNIANVGYVN